LILSLPTEEICFIRSDSFCVSFVKMSEPMNIAGNSLANSDKVRRYYSIFLNTMAGIARGFDAKILKNVGDGLVCYFPKTSGSINNSDFNDVIGFGVTAMAARHNINIIMREEKISAAVNYRISVDYGKVEVAETAASVKRIYLVHL
jgi:hypothetical protein